MCLPQEIYDLTVGWFYPQEFQPRAAEETLKTTLAFKEVEKFVILIGGSRSSPNGAWTKEKLADERHMKVSFLLLRKQQA